MKLPFAMLIALLSLQLTSVNAAIIEGTFKGTVILASDNADTNPPNPNWDNLWSDDIIGQAMSGSFRYNTALMPTNTGTTGQERYSPTNSWLEIVFNVDSKTFAISDVPTGFSEQSAYEYLNIANIGSSTGIRDFTQEYFGLSDDLTVVNGDMYSYLRGGISLLDSVLPLLNGTSLEQQFSWVDTGGDYDVVDDIPGLSLLWVENKLADKSQSGAVAARLTEVNAEIKSIELPEPSPLLIITFSLIPLVWKRWAVFNLRMFHASRRSLI